MSTLVDSSTLIYPTVLDSEELFLTPLLAPNLTPLPSSSESSTIHTLVSEPSPSETFHSKLSPTKAHIHSLMDPPSSTSTSSSSSTNSNMNSNQDMALNLNFWAPILAASGGVFLFLSLGLVLAYLYRRRKLRKQSRIIQSIRPASHTSLHKKKSNFSIMQHRYEMQFNLPMEEDVSDTSSSSFTRHQGKLKDSQKEGTTKLKYTFMNETPFNPMLRPSTSFTDLNVSHSMKSNPTSSSTMSTFTHSHPIVVGVGSGGGSRSSSSIKTRMAMEPNHVVVLHKCIWKLLRQYIASTFWSKTVWILFEFGMLLTHPENLSKYVWANQAKTPLEVFQYVFQVCCQPLQFQYHRPLSEQIKISDAFQQTFQKEWRHALQLLLKEAHAPVTHAMVLLHCYVYYLFLTKSYKPNIFWMQEKSVCSLQQLAKINDSEPIWPGLFQLSKDDPNGYICICPPLNEHDESM